MSKKQPFIQLLLAECIGTAALLAIGLSIVILFWGEGSPLPALLPGVGARRLVTGFLFGTTGCLITLSRVGKISGAHINPAVSMAFWLQGTMKTGAMLGYIASQLLGAILGSLVLLIWGTMGASIHYGNTVPGAPGLTAAFLGEVITTAMLITVLFVFSGKKRWQKLTPFTIPFLYCIMNWAEAPLSGCSTNPARSLGPAVLTGIFNAHWLYWLAPMSGVLVVTMIVRASKMHLTHRLQTARVSYHNHPTHENIRKPASHL